MLSELVIRDFAIIENLTVDFKSGLTVLSGETGAGKSIVIDALQLVTGSRAESSFVRHGTEKAEIIARFEIETAPWMSQLEIEPEAGEALILRRVITAEGRSRAYINDIPVSVSRLKEAGSKLVEVHAQHEHYALLQAATQQQLLDTYAQSGRWLVKTAESARQWQQLNEALAKLRSQASLSEAELQLLRYQLEELEPWIDQANQIEQLHERHQLASASQDIALAVDSSINDLDDGQFSAAKLISEAMQQLQRPSSIDPKLVEPRQLTESALIQLQEAVALLHQYRNHNADSEEDIADLEHTLSQLHDLARKHRVEVVALPDQLQVLNERIHTAEQAEGREAELVEQIKSCEQAYQKQAAALSQQRRKAARKLQTAIQSSMTELGLGKGVFEVDIQTDVSASPAALGQDTIEFKVAMNPGQPSRALSKVASGGELSRIGLALRVVLSESEPVPVMVFDEVDSGIGGAIAQIVGEKLRTIARQCQVFCVTHLPQVAAQGHHHYQISKQSKGKKTQTQLRALPEAERVEEISRMLGGVEITPQTRAHATEMLNKADA